MPNVNKNVHTAVADFIVSVRYNPPSPLPPLKTYLWGRCSATPAMNRAAYSFAGKVASDYCVGLMILELVSGKPVGFAMTMKNIIQSDAVLKNAMKKIDARYVKNVNRVDGGFFTYLGAYWYKVNQSMSACMKFLRPILGPLVRVAEQRYIAFYAENPAQAVEDPARGNNLSADLQFLHNVWQVQIESETAAAERSSESEPTTSSTSAPELVYTGIEAAELLAMMEDARDPIPSFKELEETLYNASIPPLSTDWTDLYPCPLVAEGEVRYSPIPKTPVPATFGLNEAGLAASEDPKLMPQLGPSPDGLMFSGLTHANEGLFTFSSRPPLFLGFNQLTPSSVPLAPTSSLPLAAPSSLPLAAPSSLPLAAPSSLPPASFHSAITPLQAPALGPPFVLQQATPQAQSSVAGVSANTGVLTPAPVSVPAANTDMHMPGPGSPFRHTNGRKSQPGSPQKAVVGKGPKC